MFSRSGSVLRKFGLPRKVMLLGLILALFAGIVGPAVRNDGWGFGSDDTARMARALAKAPKQKPGSAEYQGVDDPGVPSKAEPKSLQSKYPPLGAGAVVTGAERAQVKGGQSQPRGFDSAASKELPERRTATERTYRNPDGTLTTEFNRDSVNYRAADGAYRPIDTTLVPKDKAPGWRNAADAVELGFAPSSAAGSLVDVRVDEQHRFGFSIEGAANSLGMVTGSSVTYPSVRQATDVRLDVLPGGVKETLVLASPDAPHSWVFPLQLQGLTPSLEDGRVALLDAAGAERAQIPAGFMTDSLRNPETGDAATSYGVTYHLIDRGGKPALQVDLDSAWLRDPARRYPVEVDPSIDTAKPSAATVFQTGGRVDGGAELRIGTNGSTTAASYLAFDGVESRLRNHKIFGAYLSLANSWSWSCQPRPVTVHAVIAPWSSSGAYPGPATGPALAQSSFAHGFSSAGQVRSNCPSAYELINLGDDGRDLIQRWVNGEQANYGLSVRASATDRTAWKKFTGTRTASPPRLYVSYTQYDAEYELEGDMIDPPVLRTQDGKVKITVTNRSVNTWTAADYALGYRVYTAGGDPVGSVESASLPYDLPRGDSVTLDATIKAIDPGDYIFDFSMLRRGGPWFTDEQIPPMRLAFEVIDVPPAIKAQYPPNGYSAQTLTPQLWADAVDIDAPPEANMKYRFEICQKYTKNPDGSLDGESCVDSGYLDERMWTVPIGSLRWSKDYQWRVFAFDGHAESQKLTPSHLLTAVPQPEITSHLANAPYTGAQRDFDPQTGNYFSSAIDVTLSTTGPPLTVARTYNSLDPRRDLAFGAGWSTQYDMRVVPDSDGSGNVVITYPDGQQVRFGRNHDGSYAPPPGRQANLHAEVEGAGGGWILVDKASTVYQFRPDGRVIGIHDKAGNNIELDYGTPERLKRAISRTSDRILYFTWTGNHVSSVSTDPIDGKQLTWNYTYDGDRLKKVCDPTGGCTEYQQVQGSHYRSTILDALPASYWRLGESEGTVASSQIGAKQGKDKGTYIDVGLGQPGPLKNAANTAAGFNGTSSVITLPDGTLRKNRDLAVEMWFRTEQSGPLLGYQSSPLGESSESAAPVLYVGVDGKLRGQFWNGGVAPITSAARVDNNEWHHVILSGSLATQTLYLDGRKVGTAEGEIDHDAFLHNQIGAAIAASPADWPSWGSVPKRFFAGQIDEVAFYEHPIGPTAAASHFQAYAGTDYLSQITLPSGRLAASMSYDTEADRLRELTDRDGGHWKLQSPLYVGNEGNLVRTTQVTDPGGRLHFYEYDPVRGRILRYLAPLGQTTRPEDRRDNTGNPAPPTIPGCPTPTTPPANGDPGFCGGPVNGGVDWVGGPANGLGVRAYDYDDTGYQTTITDELGNQVVLVVDDRGNVVSKKTCRIAPGNCQTSYTSYYLNPTDATDPRNDKPIETRDARSANATDPKYVTKLTYTGVGVRGLLESQTAPDGGVVRHLYTDGNEAAIGGGNAPKGLIKQTTDPRGGLIRYSYFSNGDLAKVVNPAGLITTYTYDALGRKLTDKQTSDAFLQGLTTSYAYDALSHLVSVTQPPVTNAQAGVTHKLQAAASYDRDGNAVRVEQLDLAGSDPSRVTQVEYDERGRPSRITDAENHDVFYGYDGFGNKVWMVDPGGNKYEYAYTARNAISEVRLRAWHGQATDPGAGEGDGEPGNAELRDTLVLNSYAYDLAGRLIRQTDAMGRTTRYQHYNDDKVWKVIAEGIGDPDRPSAPKRDIALSVTTYDAAGNPTKVVTPGGAVTQYEYDPTGRRTAEIHDPANLANRTEFSYSTNNDLIKVKHTGNSSNSTRLDTGRVETVEYGYDVAGRQTSSTIWNGGSTKFVATRAYDQRGLLTSVTDPRGNVVGADPMPYTSTFTYDALGRQTDAVGATVAAETGGNQPAQVQPRTTAGYNTFGETTISRDANGNVSTVVYDRLGRPVETTSPDYRKPGAATSIKAVVKTEYDALGNVRSVTDPLGAVTRNRYDQLNRLVERTEPKANAGDQPGGVWQYTYTPTGQPLSVTDPTGARTESTYDELGRKLTSTMLERRPEPAAFTTSMRYDDAGNLTSSTAPTGETVRYAYDVLGQRTFVTDPAGVISKFGYDITGRQVRASDGVGRTSYLTFDPAGRNTSTMQLDADEHILRKTSSSYDPAGNRLTSTDPYNRTTKFTYDNHSRLVRQEEPVSDDVTITTGFGYDAAGKPTRFTDGRGNATIQTYNSWGLAESTIEPGTTTQPDAADRTWTVGYDPSGRPTTEQAPGGVTREKRFDALGRLIGETGTGAAQPTAERVRRFDELGRLVAVGSPGGEKTFTYNDRGAMLTSTGPASGTSSYTYDAASRLTERSDKAGTAKFTYLQGRLATQTDGLTGAKQTVGYDDAGAVASIDYGSGRTRAFGHDEYGRLTSDVLKGAGASTLASSTYGYDLKDLLTNKKTTGTAGAGDNAYGYDYAGRLKSWTLGGKTTAYEWDASGNRTKAGDKTATFDARNRQLTDGADTLAWSPRGTLDSRTNAGGSVASGFDAFDRGVKQADVSFGYDGLDRMSTRNGQSFGYDGVSLDLISDGAAVFARGSGGQVLAQRSGGGTKQLAITDLHQDVVAGLDPVASSLAGSTGYDPFGSKLGTSGASSPLGYQSDYTDPDSGNVDMGARWYTPGTGTFSARDDIALPHSPSAAANRYTYGNASPVNGVDADGHMNTYIFCSLFGILCQGSGVQSYFAQFTGGFTGLEQMGAKVIGGSQGPGPGAGGRGNGIAGAGRSVNGGGHPNVPSVPAAVAQPVYGGIGSGGMRPPVSTSPSVPAVGVSSTTVADVQSAIDRMVAASVGVFPPVQTVNEVPGSEVAGSFWGDVGNGLMNSIADVYEAAQRFMHPQTLEEAGHNTLDVLGLIPGFGEIFDGLNAAWYLGEGDKVNAALSGASAIPFAGWAAAVGKAGRKLVVGAGEAAAKEAKAVSAGAGAVPQGAKAASNAAEAGTAGSKATPVAPPRRGSNAASESGTGASCPSSFVPQSFVAGTKVELADGSAKAIEDLELGDQVAAADPITGQTGSRPVVATIVGEGLKDLVRLTVDTDGALGSATDEIVATNIHLFWQPKVRQWVAAGTLRPGDVLQTANGANVTVTASDQWSEQTKVYNLTVDELHTYFVLAGGVPVLVHNTNKPIPHLCGSNGGPVFSVPKGSAGGTGAGKRIPKSVLADYEIGVGAPAGSIPPVCSYCRVNPANAVDHVHPRSKSGDLTDDNLTPACTFCNSSKRDRVAPLNAPPGYSGPWPPPWWSAAMQATVPVPRIIP